MLGLLYQNILRARGAGGHIRYQGEEGPVEIFQWLMENISCEYFMESQ